MTWSVAGFSVGRSRYAGYCGELTLPRLELHECRIIYATKVSPEAFCNTYCTQQLMIDARVMELNSAVTDVSCRATCPCCSKTFPTARKYETHLTGCLKEERDSQPKNGREGGEETIAQTHFERTFASAICKGATHRHSTHRI